MISYIYHISYIIKQSHHISLSDHFQSLSVCHHNQCHTRPHCFHPHSVYTSTTCVHPLKPIISTLLFHLLYAYLPFFHFFPLMEPVKFHHCLPRPVFSGLHFFFSTSQFFPPQPPVPFFHHHNLCHTISMAAIPSTPTCAFSTGLFGSTTTSHPPTSLLAPFPPDQRLIWGALF